MIKDEVFRAEESHYRRSLEANKEKAEQITSDHLRKQKRYRIFGFPIMLEISKLATVFFWNKLKLIYHSNLNSIIKGIIIGPYLFFWLAILSILYSFVNYIRIFLLVLVYLVIQVTVSESQADVFATHYQITSNFTEHTLILWGILVLIGMIRQGIFNKIAMTEDEEYNIAYEALVREENTLKADWKKFRDKIAFETAIKESEEREAEVESENPQENSVQIENPEIHFSKPEYFVKRELPKTEETRDEHLEYLSGRPTIMEIDIDSKTVDGGKKTLLKDINGIRIRQGSLVAILGVTGSGKTTLMNYLNGMEASGASGEVRFENRNILNWKKFLDVKHMIGSVPQENFLHNERRVERELAAAARDRLPKGTTTSEINEHIDKVLKELNLETVRERKIGRCSGGQKRRIMIATELVAERELLLLDEPEAGLDIGTKRELFETLKYLTCQLGRTIIVISHDISYIDYSDSVIFLKTENKIGTLAGFGTPNQIRKKYNAENLADIYDVVGGEV